jgi:hypothetical protein
LLSEYESDVGIEIELQHSLKQLRVMVDEERRESQNQHEFRARMLKFCLDEAVTPGMVLEAYAPGVNKTTTVPSRVRRLVDDLALQIVTRATCAFRA